MNEKIILDFHLFEGEGGGEAGATASQPGSTQDTKIVQYGKSTGEGQANSQVGTDNGTGANDLNAEWEALTGKGGKFHDLLGQRVSGAVQERFKNQADLQGQIDQISEGLTPMFMNYGLKLGDFEGLQAAIANDDDLYKAGAERAGLDVEQYKKNLKLQADSDRLHQIEESYRQEQQRQAKFEAWESDAAELQQAFPAFDLVMEIQTNAKFKQLLDNGVDVKTAFQVAHIEELNNGMSAYAQRTATQQVVNNIAQRAARPMEGALNHAPAIERKSDPSKLTKEDFERIDEIVAAGGSVAF